MKFLDSSLPFQLHKASNIDMASETVQIVIEATNMGRMGAVKTFTLNIPTRLLLKFLIHMGGLPFSEEKGGRMEGDGKDRRLKEGLGEEDGSRGNCDWDGNNKHKIFKI